MKIKKLLSMTAFIVSMFITQIGRIHAFDLVVKPNDYSKTSDIYVMNEINKEGKEHFLFEFSLFYLGRPFSDIISESKKQPFKLKITGNQLNKLKRTIRLLNNFQKQRDQLSWGEEYEKLHELSNVQHVKFLKCLEEVFKQNHYVLHYIDQ